MARLAGFGDRDSQNPIGEIHIFPARFQDFMLARASQQ